MKSQTELTPELAATLLANPHPRQRNISRQIRDQYARAMREGRWVLIDDPILVVGPTHAGPNDPQGSMFNGAHRASAVVESRATIPVYIDWDADPSTFDVIDVGRRRSPQQFVSANYGAARAAAARLILWYERRFDRPPGGVNLAFDLHEILAATEQHHEALDATLAMAMQTAEYTGLAPSVCTAAYVIAYEQGLYADVSNFVDGVVEPGARRHGDPARLLSDRFRKQANRARRRSTQDDWTVLTRALNLHFEGRTASRLTLGQFWPRVGEGEESFQKRCAALSAAKAYQNESTRSGRKVAAS